MLVLRLIINSLREHNGTCGRQILVFSRQQPRWIERNCRRYIDFQQFLNRLNALGIEFKWSSQLPASNGFLRTQANKIWTEWKNQRSPHLPRNMQGAFSKTGSVLTEQAANMALRFCILQEVLMAGGLGHSATCTQAEAVSCSVRHPGAVLLVPCQGREMICESRGSGRLMCTELRVPVQPG